MDAYRHVNNVQYLRLLEDARIAGIGEWFSTPVTGVELGFLVSRHEIEYLYPLTFRQAPVEVDMWVHDIGGASFTVGYVVRDPDSVGDRVYCHAETGMVNFDFAADRPRRLSDEQRTVLRAHLREQVRFRHGRRA